ncbi:hypothetical protein AKO1_013038 [Acrasis kona]|uniref:Nuclear condensin complex subunit 3 C-terminal domain-containing protein n=1 Tax=Acrasis kona TaxID=1008807 RepID=A0AAW2Z0T4_9EUKA
MKHTSDEFITRELLCMAKYLDYADEVGRKHMYTILCEYLTTFKQPEQFVVEIIQTLIPVCAQREEFVSTIITRVDNLRLAASKPIRDDEQVASAIDRLETQIKDLTKSMRRAKQSRAIMERELKDAVENEEYEQAQALKMKIKAMQTDAKHHEQELKDLDQQLRMTDGDDGLLTHEVAVLVRAMSIMHHFLGVRSDPKLDQSSPVRSFSIKHEDVDQCQFLINDLILNNIHHKIDFVREFCYKILGQFCSLKLELASKHSNVLIENLRTMDESSPGVMIATVQGITDIIMVYKQEDLATFELGDDFVSRACDLFKKLVADTKDADLRATLVQSIAKLLLVDKLPSDKQSEFIILFLILLFDPSTENEHQMRQCLTVFIPAYSLSFYANMVKVSSVVVRTLRRVAAHTHGPITRINLTQLCQYMIHLTSVNQLHEAKSDEKRDSLHEQIIVELCYEILSDPDSSSSSSYCRSMDCFSLLSTDVNQLTKVKLLLEKIPSVVQNKQPVKVVDKLANAAVAAIDKISDQDDEIDQDAISDEIDYEIEVYKEEYRQQIDDFRANEEEPEETAVSKPKRKATTTRKAAAEPKKVVAASSSKSKSASKKTTTKKTTSTKKTTKATKRKKVESEKESTSSESEQVVMRTRTKHAKSTDDDASSPPSKYKKATKSAKPTRDASRKKSVVFENVSSDEEEQPKKPKSNVERNLTEEFELENVSSEEDEEDEEEQSKKPAPKKRVTDIRREIESIIDQNVSSDEDEEEEQPKKSAPKKRVTAIRKEIEEIIDDVQISDEEDDE